MIYFSGCLKFLMFFPRLDSLRLVYGEAGKTQPRLSLQRNNRGRTLNHFNMCSKLSHSSYYTHAKNGVKPAICGKA